MNKMDLAIVWFRKDLRLSDNPALFAALSRHKRIIPLFVLDEKSPGFPGSSSLLGLHHALASLNLSLRNLGSRLIIQRGRTEDVVIKIAHNYKVCAIYFNKCYEPFANKQDLTLQSSLKKNNIEVHSFNGTLLFDPSKITNNKGNPFKVFTAFWKYVLKQPVDKPLPAPDALPPVPNLMSLSLDDLELLPKISWDTGLREFWNLSENAAQKRLLEFVSGPLAEYSRLRDYPALKATSQLSPALHFGLLSPRQVYWAVMDSALSQSKSAERFIAELIWREFAYYLLFHFPNITDEPMDERFKNFPWRRDDYSQDLKAWQKGRTGIPIVDAGMRELWRIGWMHNRVRMIVASFLCKNLLIPWQEGAKWFWDTLVDADLAINSMGWQWIAGCGIDAVPYFRIFNPILQGQKFDPKGNYVRQWVPELKNMPDEYIHRPWMASETVLSQAGIRLGHDYPKPIVDLDTSRKRALSAFEKIKNRRKNVLPQA